MSLFSTTYSSRKKGGGEMGALGRGEREKDKNVEYVDFEIC